MGDILHLMQMKNEIWFSIFFLFLNWQILFIKERVKETPTTRGKNPDKTYKTPKKTSKRGTK